VIRRRRRRLDDEHVFAAHIFLDLHKRLAVGKRLDGAFAELAADGFANGPGQRFIRCAAENFHELMVFVFLVKTAVVAPERRFAAPRRRKKPPLPADEIAKRL
jgi:hypothetical protein